MNRGDFHSDVVLAVTLVAVIAFATLEFHDADFIAVLVVDDVGGDRGTIDIRLANRGVAFVGTDEHDFVKRDRGGIFREFTGVDTNDVALGDFDLRSAVFDDGVHRGCPSCFRIEGTYTAPRGMSSQVVYWNVMIWQVRTS